MSLARVSVAACLLTALAVFAVVLGRSATVDAPPADTAYRALPALPASAPAATGDLEAAAVRLADALRSVPLSEGGETCPATRLQVSWDEAPAGARHGAHLEPIGPAPTPATTSVNGIVLCAGSTHGYMGFEAWREQGAWRLAAVPFIGEHGEDESALPQATSAHTVTPLRLPSADAFSGPVDAYAANEPQRTCEPTPKPGTVALAELLIGAHPGTRDLGIARDCGAGGESEHKEGRAFDWGVLVDRPAEKAAADAFVDALLAPDAVGNEHALARRMGVMYVIWDGRIWSAGRAAEGWRAYGGASAHTDHVHISLTWDGAMGRTSFWTEDPEAPAEQTPPEQTPPEQALPEHELAPEPAAPQPSAPAGEVLFTRGRASVHAG